MYTDGRKGRDVYILVGREGCVLKDVCILMEGRGGMYVYWWGREGRDVCILVEGRGGMYVY